MDAALPAATLSVVLVNPHQVRDFARSRSIRIKTDRVDTQVLARFAAEVRPPLRPRLSAASQHLHDLDTRRRQPLTAVVADKQRPQLARGRHRRPRGMALPAPDYPRHPDRHSLPTVVLRDEGAIGVDAAKGLVHTVATPAANAADSCRTGHI